MLEGIFLINVDLISKQIGNTILPARTLLKITADPNQFGGRFQSEPEAHEKGSFMRCWVCEFSTPRHPHVRVASKVAGCRGGEFHSVGRSRGIYSYLALIHRRYQSASPCFNLPWNTRQVYQMGPFGFCPRDQTVRC
jgi:hypothetical protein